MTYVIPVTNVNQAFGVATEHLLKSGIREDSRNGKVIVAPGPVVTEYHNPTERVLYSPLRDANPFFHVMESLWMLAGRNDVEFVKQFNSRIDKYSDDGSILHGAYGHRWKSFPAYDNHFDAEPLDQIELVVDELRRLPESRRVVLSMWCPRLDLGRDGLDVPCNTQAYFDRRGGKLNMTVCCRSNDMVWGAYGANVVHFSFLQEYLASALGIEVGVYRQFSNNFHVYLDTFGEDYLKAVSLEAQQTDYYEGEKVQIFPLMLSGREVFDKSLKEFMTTPFQYKHYEEPFFTCVAQPMAQAWQSHKLKDQKAALKFAEEVQGDDWRVACVTWLQRRYERKV